MTPQELKNSILQMAIQGKLVEQRPVEGTGEELYQQIQAEKQKLIKAGTIKKGKPLPDISEEELLIDIPDNWKWVRFGELLQVISGTSYKKHDICQHGLRILRGGNIQDMSVTLYDDDIFLPENYMDENKQIKIGDIIIVASTGSLKVIGKPAYIKCNYPNTMIGAFLRICRPISRQLANYIKIIFESEYYRSHIRNIVKGTNINNIKESYITELLIPLPPFEEQKRIVAKIDELLPYIDRYAQAWSKLEDFNKRFPVDLQKSILQMAIQGKLVEQRTEEGTADELYSLIQLEKKSKGFYDNKKMEPITEDLIPYDIPENWRWVRFGDIAEYNMGKTPPRAEAEWWKPEHPWVSIADMPENGHITSTKEWVSTNAIIKKFGNKVSKAGTMIMSFKLTVGRVSILDIDAVHNEAIISIYPFCDADKSIQSYLFKLLPTVTQYGDTKNAIKGKTLNNTSICNLLIPLPPLAEQKRIVAKIEEILPLCEKLNSDPLTGGKK